MAKMKPKTKPKCKVINITNSCGSQGCDLQPYIMPYLGGKEIPFTKFPSKKAA